MKRILTISALLAMALLASAQEKKSFTTLREIPITSVKNQYKSGTCWAHATLGYLEAEILRQSGKTYDLSEMFVVGKDYMDCATHYVRMHGFSQISQGGSCEDVIEVIRHYGICPQDAMPAYGAVLVGDSLARFKVFFPELEKRVSSAVVKGAKHPAANWQDGVQELIDQYLGRCPETFEYEGHTYTPLSFAQSLGLHLDDYVSLTSYTHHPFQEWFVLVQVAPEAQLQYSYRHADGTAGQGPGPGLYRGLGRRCVGRFLPLGPGLSAGRCGPHAGASAAAMGQLGFHLRPRHAHLREGGR